MTENEKETEAARLAYGEIIAIIQNPGQVIKEKLMETMLRIEREWGQPHQN
jgi:hypothetical protein